MTTTRPITHPDQLHDRTVKDWHRTLPPNYAATDIDLLGYCRQCHQPIYLIEDTSTNAKPTWLITMFHNLATTLHIPAILIIHRNGHIIGGRTWTKPTLHFPNQTALENYIHHLRNQHNCPQKGTTTWHSPG